MLKKELKKCAISCGYKPGATLFGGVNRSEAKIVRILSKNIGLPKLEADLCRYQRHHIAGSLLYANFKVTNIIAILLLLLLFRSFFNEDCFDRVLGLCFVAEGLIERSDPRMKLFAQDSRRCLFAELRHYKPT
jgi:hypothetical protein